MAATRSKYLFMAFRFLRKMAKTCTHPCQNRIFFFPCDEIIPVYTLRTDGSPAGGPELFFVQLLEKPIPAPPSTTPTHAIRPQSTT